MPIPLKNNFRRISKVIRVDLRNFDDYLVVWWYSGLYKNIKDASQPQVLVAFRKLIDFNSLSDELVYVRLPVTILGQLRVGTIWRNGECWGEILFDSNEFDVEFTPDFWELTSFQQALGKGQKTPYPAQLYPLQYKSDQNWLLEFKLSNNGKLVVPCLEFFSRCYGRSAELRRVLITYPWDELWSSRLYAPLDEPEEPGKWKIKLRKRLVNGDAILLAHSKYDEYTRNVVKKIHAQAQARYDPGNNKPAFIQIEPWFLGPAKLKVKGLSFGDGKSFLAVQIIGCSDPGGESIWGARENASDAKNPALDSEDGSAWAGVPPRKLIKYPDIVDLTDAVEPDSNASSVEIEDPDFEILGTPRIVHKMRRGEAKTSAGLKSTGTEASAFSSGEAHGSGQGVGHAAIHAKPVLESHGMLRDMWNAMLFLKERHPNIIQTVQWFTFEDGYQSDTEPKLIALEPFEEGPERLGSTTWKWPYIDIKTMRELRGVLVMRIVANGKPIHVLEIQRRPQTRKDKNGEIIDSEESYQGLVFALHKQNELEQWLSLLLSDIRFVKGVVKQLVENCPGKASAFRHAPANGEQVPCEASALNALRKMGIVFI